MTHRTERLLWAIAACCCLIAIIVARQPMQSRDRASPARSVATAASLTMFDAARLATDQERTITHDPFRLERSPANVAFGDSAAAALAAGAARTLVPIQGIVLKGIVGGPPWQAVLTGVPGRNGMIVVHAGDTLARLRVRRVNPNSVVLAGPDSLITLTLQRAWQ